MAYSATDLAAETDQIRTANSVLGEILSVALRRIQFSGAACVYFSAELVQ